MALCAHHFPIRPAARDEVWPWAPARLERGKNDTVQSLLQLGSERGAKVDVCSCKARRDAPNHELHHVCDEESERQRRPQAQQSAALRPRGSGGGGQLSGRNWRSGRRRRRPSALAVRRPGQIRRDGRRGRGGEARAISRLSLWKLHRKRMMPEGTTVTIANTADDETVFGFRG